MSHRFRQKEAVYKMLTFELVAVGGSGVLAGTTLTLLAMMPRLVRVGNIEGASRQLGVNFQNALEEARSTAKAQGFIEGKAAY
jgi:hypothetical protein